MTTTLDITNLTEKSLDRLVQRAILNEEIFQLIDLVINTYRIGNEFKVYDQILDRYGRRVEIGENTYIAKFNTLKHFIKSVREQYDEKYRNKNQQTS